MTRVRRGAFATMARVPTAQLRAAARTLSLFPAGGRGGRKLGGRKRVIGAHLGGRSWRRRAKRGG